MSADPSAGRRRRRRLRLLLVAASTLASFGLAEIAWRVLRPAPDDRSVAATGDQYHFYRHDPRLGWANAAGAHGTFARDEFRYEVRINSHGMRQREVALAKTPGLRRIAVLGDSFVWGIGVDDEQRFTERLERRLFGVEVLNFGVSGYAPIQHLLDLDRVLAFAPDLVVLTFCLGNDFVDNVQYVRYGYYKPYAELDEHGALRIAGGDVPDTRAFGFANRPRWLGSELLGSLAHALAADPAQAQQRGLGLLAEKDMYADDLDDGHRAQRDRAIAINEALLAAIADRLRAAAVPFLVVAAPTKFEYSRKGATGHEGRFDQVERMLAASCGRLGIAFVPTVQVLHGDDFWHSDGHWTPRGHEKIAAALADRLAAAGYERAR